MATKETEKRDIYIEMINARLVQYNAKLSEMRGKAAEIQADMKLEYLSQIENLEKKRDECKQKHDELKKAGIHAWEDVKAGAEKAWTELGDSIEKAASHFH